MKDPEVQEAVNTLQSVINKLNDINAFLQERDVSFTIKEVKGEGRARSFQLDNVTQLVHYKESK